MLNTTRSTLTKSGAELVNISDCLPTETIEEISDGLSVETFEYDLNKYLNGKGEATPYKTLKELNDLDINVMQMNLTYLVEDPDGLVDSFEEMKSPYSKKVGAYQRLPEWQKILKGRKQISKVMEENDIDAIMYMTFFDVPGIEDFIIDNHRNQAGYDTIFGPIFGLPEITLPMGFSGTDKDCKNELPVGISVFADFGQEETLM